MLVFVWNFFTLNINEYGFHASASIHNKDWYDFNWSWWNYCGEDFVIFDDLFDSFVINCWLQVICWIEHYNTDNDKMVHKVTVKSLFQRFTINASPSFSSFFLKQWMERASGEFKPNLNIFELDWAWHSFFYIWINDICKTLRVDMQDNFLQSTIYIS